MGSGKQPVGPDPQTGPAGVHVDARHRFPAGPDGARAFGYAVHHVLRARFCIERGRFWQAEYWISSARDYILNLFCLRRGLPANHARGFDALPAEVLDVFKPSFVKSLEREELMRALTCVIEGMFKETDDVQELAAKVEPRLRALTLPFA